MRIHPDHLEPEGVSLGARDFRFLKREIQTQDPETSQLQSQVHLTPLEVVVGLAAVKALVVAGHSAEEGSVGEEDPAEGEGSVEEGSAEGEDPAERGDSEGMEGSVEVEDLESVEEMTAVEDSAAMEIPGEAGHPEDSEDSEEMVELAVVGVVEAVGLVWGIGLRPRTSISVKAQTFPEVSCLLHLLLREFILTQCRREQDRRAWRLEARRAHQLVGGPPLLCVLTFTRVSRKEASEAGLTLEVAWKSHGN